MAKLVYMEDNIPRTRNFDSIQWVPAKGKPELKKFAGVMVLLNIGEERMLIAVDESRGFRPAKGNRWRDLMLIMWGILGVIAVRQILLSI